jgi:hypothetical protein
MHPCYVWSHGGLAPEALPGETPWLAPFWPPVG